jgi:3-hydroxyisobutyrate dehydrogenase-like beta-hydroxyacid dehydrogenase
MGVNTELSKLAANVFKRAKEAGHGREELAALIKVFRKEALVS